MFVHLKSTRLLISSAVFELPLAWKAKYLYVSSCLFNVEGVLTLQSKWVKKFQTKHLEHLMSTRPLCTGWTSFSGHGRRGNPEVCAGGLGAKQGPADAAVSVKRGNLCIWSWPKPKEIRPRWAGLPCERITGKDDNSLIRWAHIHHHKTIRFYCFHFSCKSMR